MKKLSLYLAGVLFAALCSFSLSTEQEAPIFEESAEGFREMDNSAFKEGEKLKFKLHYGWINAGTAELGIEERLSTLNDRNCYRIIGTGKTKKSFDLFFTVRDRYETFIDVESIMPWRFVRDVNEDGYIIKRDISFDQINNTAQCKFDKTNTLYDLPSNVQDMISSFYYARCAIDFTDIQVGDFYIIPIFMDYEMYPLRITYTGKENVKTSAGKFRCLVFKPAVQEGRIFEDDEDLTIYVSDDANKMPVQVKADVLIGSIKLSLTDFSGMRNPINSLIK